MSSPGLQARGGGDSSVSTSTLKRAAAAEAGGASSASAPMPKRQMPTKRGSGLGSIGSEAIPPPLGRWRGSLVGGSELLSAALAPPRSESDLVPPSKTRMLALVCYTFWEVHVCMWRIRATK